VQIESVETILVDLPTIRPHRLSVATMNCQALGLSFTVSTIALAIGLVNEHAFAFDDLRASIFALAPALVGMRIGQRVRGRISAQTFRRRFFICLLGLGVQLMARAFVL
jgi:uncharacterized protein